LILRLCIIQEWKALIFDIKVNNDASIIFTKENGQKIKLKMLAGGKCVIEE